MYDCYTSDKPTKEQNQRRFMKYVKKDESGCWMWSGSVCKTKGPMFFLDGKMRPANRCSYTLFIGDATPCKAVRRTCGNSSCVNPDHLQVKA